MRITIIDVENPEGKRPHKKGFVDINGVEYEFACWPAKSGKAGVYSGALTPKGDRKTQAGTQDQSRDGYSTPAQPPKPREGNNVGYAQRREGAPQQQQPRRNHGGYNFPPSELPSDDIPF